MKQKVDFSRVTIENLDDYVGLFYEDQMDQKIKGA